MDIFPLDWKEKREYDKMCIRDRLDKALEAVVAVDHTAVEVIQVGGREAAAVELDHRADLRRNDRDHIKNHPLWPVVREAEALHMSLIHISTPFAVIGGRSNRA